MKPLSRLRLRARRDGDVFMTQSKGYLLNGRVFEGESSIFPMDFVTP